MEFILFKYISVTFDACILDEVGHHLPGCTPGILVSDHQCRFIPEILAEQLRSKPQYVISELKHLGVISHCQGFVKLFSIIHNYNVLVF